MSAPNVRYRGRCPTLNVHPEVAIGGGWETYVSWLQLQPPIEGLLQFVEGRAAGREDGVWQRVQNWRYVEPGTMRMRSFGCPSV